MKSVNCSKPGYASINCSEISKGMHCTVKLQDIRYTYFFSKHSLFIHVNGRFKLPRVVDQTDCFMCNIPSETDVSCLMLWIETI